MLEEVPGDGLTRCFDLRDVFASCDNHGPVYFTIALIFSFISTTGHRKQCHNTKYPPILLEEAFLDLFRRRLFLPIRTNNWRLLAGEFWRWTKCGTNNLHPDIRVCLYILLRLCRFLALRLAPTWQDID